MVHMHHFFLPAELLTQADRVTLPAETAHQVARVLRLRPGETIVALDNAGNACDLTLIQVSADAVTAEITARRAAPNEPALHLTLFQSVLKKDNFEWVLQKATELGISRIVPVLTERSIATYTQEVGLQKRTRWLRILTEAAEQCRRGRIPTLDKPVLYEDSLSQAADLTAAFIPWEDATDQPLTTAVPADLPPAARLGLFIGPEGGYTPGEIELARQHGVTPVTLGPRILRAETAAIAAVTLIMAQAGELTR